MVSEHLISDLDPPIGSNQEGVLHHHWVVACKVESIGIESYDLQDNLETLGLIIHYIDRI